MGHYRSHLYHSLQRTVIAKSPTLEEELKEWQLWLTFASSLRTFCCSKDSLKYSLNLSELLKHSSSPKELWANGGCCLSLLLLLSGKNKYPGIRLCSFSWVSSPPLLLMRHHPLLLHWARKCQSLASKFLTLKKIKSTNYKGTRRNLWNRVRCFINFPHPHPSIHYSVIYRISTWTVLFK